MALLDLYSLSQLSTIVIFLSLALQQQTAAFVQPHRCSGCTTLYSFDVSGSPLMLTPNDINDVRGEPNEESEDAWENDADFYRDLGKAKLKKLGRSIPPEQARKSAVEAEGDFLQAMREAKEEFRKAKEDLGSDGAIDLFLGRIREEDEKNDEAC